MSSKILKISSIFNINSKDMLNYLTNYKTFKEWNRFLIGIFDIKKEDNSAKFRYYKSFKEEEGDFEIKLKRKIINSTQLLIVDYGDILNNNLITKLTLIESSNRNKEKCKVTVYIPLRLTIENKLPLTFLKSTINSLDLLQHFINNKNFNSSFKDNELNEIQEYITKQYSEKKRRSEMEDTGKKEKDKRDSTISFYEFDNKFSGNINQNENKENVDNIIKEEKVEKIEKEDNVKEEIVVTEEKVITPIVQIVENVDPAIAKENEELKGLVANKLKDLDEYLNRQWKVLEEKADYKLFYIDEKSGLRSIKSEVVIDKNIQTVWNFLLDINSKNKYDKNFDSGHKIRDIDDNHFIQYLKYKGKLGISPRDFVIIVYNKLVLYLYLNN
jgi:hypothetical protein